LIIKISNFIFNNASTITSLQFIIALSTNYSLCDI
jgi:hypothetical protein